MVKQKRPALQPHFGGEKKQKRPQYIPLPEVDSEEEDVDLSDEDLQFVNAHHGDLNFLARLPKKDLDRAVSQVKAPNAKEARQVQPKEVYGAVASSKGSIVDEHNMNADLWVSSDEGEEYEKRPRTAAKETKEHKPAGLPIKTLGGDVLFQRTVGTIANKLDAAAHVPSHLAVAGVTIQDDLAEQLQRKMECREAEEQEDREGQSAAAFEGITRETLAKRGELVEGGILAELSAYHGSYQRREAAKRQMAAAAQAVLQDPEGKLGEMRVILDLLGDQDSQVQRLAMLSGVAVFRDILPGYRIRPPTDKEAEMVVSKDVKRVREYEQALLRSYQALLKALLQAAQQAKVGKLPLQHGRIAVKSMAMLLVAVPHFNYTSDLLQALVPYMAHKDASTRDAACGAIRTLLSSDREGAVSVEVVQLVADLVKRRKCVVPAAVVQSLLGLDFSEIGTAEEFEEAKRQQRGKRKRKGSKDEVTKGFEEAQASASAEVQRGCQSQILEAMFELFFRVLKTCTASGLVAQRDGAPLPSSRFSRKFPLLFPTLEGLSKYAHLISVEYFVDLMSVLQQLLESSALPPPERLRCLLTAAQILKGQGEALTVDRRSFYTQLYTTLTRVSLVPLLEDDDFEHNEGSQQRQEVEAGSERQQAGWGVAGGAGPGAAPPPEERVCYLLSGLLEGMILDSKLLDVTRQAAFSKRMAAAADAAGDTGTAMGLLCVLHRMFRRQSKLRGMLENEAGGPSGYKVYKPETEDPAEAGALAVPLWELSLLARHFHPHVAQAARGLAGMASQASGGVGGSLLPLGTSPAQLAAQYSTATGGFHPAPTAAHPVDRKHAGRVAIGGGDSVIFLTAVQLGAAQDALLPWVAVSGRHAQSGASAIEAGEDNDSGMLSLPGWGVGDAVDGAGEQQRGGVMGDGDAPSGVSASFLHHFRLARGFQRNAELRQEASVARAQVAMFKRHLEERNAMERERRREEEERKAREKAERKKEDKGAKDREDGKKLEARKSQDASLSLQANRAGNGKKAKEKLPVNARHRKA